MGVQKPSGLKLAAINDDHKIAQVWSPARAILKKKNILRARTHHETGSDLREMEVKAKRGSSSLMLKCVDVKVV